MEKIITHIKHKIHFIRGHRVMLDRDLAELYEVHSKRLNEQVKRNIERFPSDFMFQLTEIELEALRCQIGILELGHGTYSKYLPFVFTEQGVAMLSTVLRSKRAVQVNIEIMRVFVRIREFMAVNVEFEKRLNELERNHSTHDKEIAAIFDAIRELVNVPKPGSRKVGFKW